MSFYILVDLFFRVFPSMRIILESTAEVLSIRKFVHYFDYR